MTTAPDGPSPPGSYPVVVVGSGPGGLQVSYALGRLGVRHAIVSADEAPGGMFRRWPFFQRLLSWTKPFAPADRATRAYERYDWNSLIADEPENRALMLREMDGTSYFPSRPEMERNLAAFAAQTAIPVRYGCRWTGTRAETGPAGERFVIETTDGEYRCRTAIFAVGVAEPFMPVTPGFEHAAGYADTRPAETYAGKRIFIAGKQNSGFELATGLLPWARQIVIASPSAAKLSVNTRSLVGIRARYLQPYEDHVLGGGVTILDAAIDSIDRTADGLTVALRRTDGGADLDVVVDEAIAATGFVAPLLDLPALGVATFGHSRLPAQTPFWESATVPGIHFAGTIGQGAGGLKKHGIPSNSGAVQGARYNARVLARHVAADLGITQAEVPIPADALVDRLVAEANGTAELWHQKAYLGWTATLRDGSFTDAGIQPLAHVLDADGPDAVILTLETDGSGATYPVVYLRQGGETEERVLDPDPFLDFSGREHRRQFADVVDRARGTAASRIPGAAHA
ncbi:MAG TPA: NAD(P)-binding domain-containing protein [Candidatus Limnocylindrales bacterium]